MPLSDFDLCICLQQHVLSQMSGNDMLKRHHYTSKDAKDAISPYLHDMNWEMLFATFPLLF